ncbi:hypothetical protein PENSPDRAFT_482767 [Peniophora sp. CONT]|nr:hypothetical protein PENSPDRAFT_482767 [Peniophora sp. CONT]
MLRFRGYACCKGAWQRGRNIVSEEEGSSEGHECFKPRQSLLWHTAFYICPCPFPSVIRTSCIYAAYITLQVFTICNSRPSTPFMGHLCECVEKHAVGEAGSHQRTRLLAPFWNAGAT